MKSLLKITSIVLISLLALNTYAQKAPKPFEGIIKYAIDIEGDEVDAATRAQLPSEIAVYYKGTKNRVDMVTPLYSIFTISDTEDGSLTQMFDMMGQQFYVVQTAEQMAELKGEETEKPQIEFIDETKRIAGYDCKKAEIHNGDDIMEVYYCNDLNIPRDENSQYQVEGIDGILMEYSVEQQGMYMKFSVKEIVKKKQKASLFKVPAEFEKKTMEELGTMFGG
ncbi:MAG: DUF4412 domain-containing protein [Bacteroidales bacterium]|nr:DUF4412 domain-containing protein [Bacteroidales bacterium]